MNINEIIMQMKLDVTTLSLGEKIFGGLAVTILSMCIVFLVLILLMFSIKAMTKIFTQKDVVKTIEPVTASTDTGEVKSAIVDLNIEEEVAAIIAAISSMNGVRENKLVIRNISMASNNNWEVQGRINQILTRI